MNFHISKRLFSIRTSFFLALPLLATFCSADQKARDEKLTALEKRVEAVEQKLQPRQRPPQADPNVVVNIPLDDLDVKRGKGKAILVEAFDFACPYCAMSAKTLDELVEKYGNDVTVVSKQYVVHPDTATLPALAACAATKQKKGPEFEAALWKQAWKWDTGSPRFDATQTQAPALDKLAKEIRLDVAQFQKDRDGAECKTYFDKQQQQLASAGVNGTPSLFVNGKRYQGPRTADALKTALLAP